MIKHYSLLILFCSIQTLFGQYKNVVIFGPENSPNEPSIWMDVKRPNLLVAGSNLNLVALSTDTGRTWTRSMLESSFGVWGDPVIISDTNSDFYYFHLSLTPGKPWLDRIVCQKMDGLTNSWSDGSHTFPDGKQHDKEWAVVDRSSNRIYMTWTVFDRYASTNPKDSSHILFSSSDDNGFSWSAPKRIDERGGDCIDNDNTVEGAVPAVGINNEVYVCWSGHEKIYFDKSTDGGNSWLNDDKIIAEQYGGWAYDIPGLQRCNGLPAIACDLSKSDYRGTIYINYTDQKYGESDTDVWLIKSSDNGETWSAPIRVNNDLPGKQQFLTWMTIDQTNGTLYFVFYDRRNYTDRFTDVYLAKSTDGGNTFNNYKISELPFIPNESTFFGDYNNITAYDGIIRPIWTRMDNGQTSILTALIDEVSLFLNVAGNDSFLSRIILEQNYPNPFINETYVHFKLMSLEDVTLSLYDSFGRLVSNIIENKNCPPGKYVEAIDAAKLRLSSGVYYYVLRTMHNSITKKLIRIL